MKKPWDNGPTPETDDACLIECWTDAVLPTGYAPASFARDLERRLRAAERLLAQAAPWVPAECVLRAAIEERMAAGEFDTANPTVEGRTAEGQQT